MQILDTESPVSTSGRYLPSAIFLLSAICYSQCFALDWQVDVQSGGFLGPYFYPIPSHGAACNIFKTHIIVFGELCCVSWELFVKGYSSNQQGQKAIIKSKETGRERERKRTRKLWQLSPLCVKFCANILCCEKQFISKYIWPDGYGNSVLLKMQDH